ncbi:MAG: permease [Rhodobiaceae bacterium]|nr:permease [Rhodobiaceae bacterium]
MTALIARLSGGRFPAIDKVWLVIAAILAGVAIFLPARLGDAVSFALSALGSTAPYIAIAVLLIGVLKATGAESLVAKAFKGRETRMIVIAALVGGLAPFCSCEVIPFVAGLLGVGAPVSAVMAFWLSSPLVDPPSLLLTAGVLGWQFAIAKAVIAVLIGLFGGFAMKAAMAGGMFADPLKARPSAGCGCGCAPKTGKPVWRFWQEPERRATFVRQASENGLFLVKWMTLAYLIEWAMVTYVPAEAIAGVVGGQGILPVVTAALVGVPAYLNGYAAPPLIAGLVGHGMSQGAAMAFMVAGAASCIPAMAAVFALVKRPVFAAYVGLGFSGAVLAGLGYGLIAG